MNTIPTSTLLDSIDNQIQDIVSQLATLEADYAVAASNIAAGKKGAQERFEQLRNQVSAKKNDLAAFQGAHAKEIERILEEQGQRLLRAQDKYRDDVAANFDQMVKAAKAVDKAVDALLETLNGFDIYRGLVAAGTRDGATVMLLGSSLPKLAEIIAHRMGAQVRNPQQSLAVKQGLLVDMLPGKDHTMNRIKVPDNFAELPKVD